MDKQALHPVSFNPIAQVKELEEKLNEEQPLIEQQALSEMSDTKGWKILNKILDEIIESIDDSVKNQMAAQASFEDIGKTSVIREITKDVIRTVRNKVNDARDAVEGRREAGREQSQSS